MRLSVSFGSVPAGATNEQLRALLTEFRGALLSGGPADTLYLRHLGSSRFAWFAMVDTAARVAGRKTGIPVTADVFTIDFIEDNPLEALLSMPIRRFNSFEAAAILRAREVGAECPPGLEEVIAGIYEAHKNDD